MFTKGRLRFSIGAMLVLMAGVAVVLNHEVQRAKAIETTVKRVGTWYGVVSFRPRANSPAFLAGILPVYWTTEINRIWVAVYTREHPKSSFLKSEEIALIESTDFNDLLELGALDDLSQAYLVGSAISYEALSRICSSPKLEECDVLDSRLSDKEIDQLKLSSPRCMISVDKY